MFMIHEGELMGASSASQKDLKAQSKMMDLVESKYNDILIKRSSLTLEQILEKTDEITWFTARQAKKWGMVEEIR